MPIRGTPSTEVREAVPIVDHMETKHMLTVNTYNYNHCDGSQLRLTDSDLGSEQYSSSDYYLWNAGSSGSQLLFIFPTRVNLNTITLHYYSDNARDSLLYQMTLMFGMHHLQATVI